MQRLSPNLALLVRAASTFKRATCPLNSSSSTATHSMQGGRCSCAFDPVCSHDRASQEAPIPGATSVQPLEAPERGAPGPEAMHGHGCSQERTPSTFSPRFPSADDMFLADCRSRTVLTECTSASSCSVDVCSIRSALCTVMRRHWLSRSNAAHHGNAMSRHRGARADRVRLRAQPEVQPEVQQPPVAEEQPEPASDACPHCGAAKGDIPFGCDQQGHRAAGAGALIPWWPIKVWNHCPKAAQAGLPYTRKGQIIDEMLFGRAPSDANKEE